MKDRMQKQDWMQIMVDSLYNKLALEISLGKSKSEAIETVKQQSTAGARVWEEVLKQL